MQGTFLLINLFLPFQLNESVSVEYVKMLDQMGMIRRKLTRAVRKDTVTVPDGGYTILRFQAINPGINIQEAKARNRNVTNQKLKLPINVKITKQIKYFETD